MCAGFVNTLINKLPVELHIPGYQFCGPGTKLKKRLARGDPGINPLDQACREHDIAYGQSSEVSQRHEADRILARKAWQRVKAKDARLGERIAALGVAGAMKGKVAIGAGLKKKKKDKAKKKKKTSTTAAKKRNSKKKTQNGKNRKTKKTSKTKTKRVLPLPAKIGGFLPLIPLILAGLSAAGAIAGGASGIAKAVDSAKTNRKALEEAARHNKVMETAIMTNRKGSGLHLEPWPKNSPNRR